MGRLMGGLLQEAGDEAALPGCLNGAWGVPLPDVGDSLAGRYPVQHGEAGQRCAGSSVSAGAGDLDALGFGAHPCFAQRVGGCQAVGRQPEVGPAKPPGFPGDGGWLMAQQVQREGGHGTRREWLAQSPTANEPAGGQPQHARRRRLPHRDHGGSVAERVGSRGRSRLRSETGAVMTGAWSDPSRPHRRRAGRCRADCRAGWCRVSSLRRRHPR